MVEGNLSVAVVEGCLDVVVGGSLLVAVVEGILEAEVALTVALQQRSMRSQSEERT